jgi:hypothetical protein
MMISPEFEEKCETMLSFILLGKDFVIGRDTAGNLFMAIGNDVCLIDNWNKWIKLKYPNSCSFTFEECMMCDGESETRAIYRGTAYLRGYSDHGQTEWQKCEYCQQGIALVIENAKNIGTYER